ncbi:hypothetical protein SAMN02910369_01297 [Lachnospiraceae bacterium NE2001]|nr:hypothetical protein SAMN02910369_01297 [Lachnospiraceae bacterium NE2001]
MQLKVTEPEETNEAGIAEGQGGTNGDNASPQDNLTSNNDYFNPELEFDYEGDGIFGNSIPQTMDSMSGNSVNGNLANGVNLGTSYGNGMNDYYSSGALDDSGSYGTSKALNSNTLGGNDIPPVGDRPRKLSKKEFFQSPRNRRDRDRIIISSIVVIVTSIFDVIRTDFWLSTFQRQIDMVNSLSEQFGLGSEYQIDTSGIMTTQIVLSVILICLGLGIFIFKSRACAAAGLAITGINFIMTLMRFRQFRMYWAFIAFVYAMLATVSFAKAWKEYEENGDWKREWSY